MINMSGNMAETSVTDFFTCQNLVGERVRGPPMFGPDHASKTWSGPDPWTGRKLTPMITGIV